MIARSLIIFKLMSAAMNMHNKYELFKPINHDTWDDCYTKQDEWHVLQFHLSKKEKSAHSIAMDDYGNLLEE